MDLNKVEKFLKENNQPKFRMEQLRKTIYQDGVFSFLEISTIPLDLRKRLEKEINVLSFTVEKVLVSDDKRSMKSLLKLSDGNCIPHQKTNSNKNHSDIKDQSRNDRIFGGGQVETVLLSPRSDTWSVCVSSQVGCPLGCAFCATGKGGFKRNLTAEEITDQVLFWKQWLKKSNLKSQISNLVFMGMGDPMLNWENVKKSVEDLINPKLFNFGSRSISISTVGVKGGIEKYLKDFPQVNLAISLHFANSEMRSRYMPANKSYNLDDIKKDLQEYFKKSKRKVFIEYIMFNGLNDDLVDAKKLVEYLDSIGNSYLLHVNLIAYNMEHGTRNKNLFEASSREKIIEFRNYLLQHKINATIRKSLGQEIQGACGQLAGK